MQPLRAIGYDTPHRAVQIQLLAFAQTAQQLGFRARTVDCTPDESPRTVLSRIAPEFAVTGLRVAVDCEYHDWDAPIGAASEIALIPPVSGG